MTDYAQMLLEGMDILIKERLKSVNFDASVKCIVTGIEKAAQGQYEVSNGSATFTAYSQETGYKVNDSVLVIIPNNDYNNQKYIIGKDISNSSEPYVYNPPFSTFIDITGNLCIKDWGDSGEGLYANGYKMGLEPSRIITDEDGNETYFTSYIWEADFANGSNTESLYAKQELYYQQYKVLSQNPVQSMAQIRSDYKSALEDLIKSFQNDELSWDEYTEQIHQLQALYHTIIYNNKDLYKQYTIQVFIKTNDTALDENHTYYLLQNGNYVQVINPLRSQLSNYYVKYNDMIDEYYNIVYNLWYDSCEPLENAIYYWRLNIVTLQHQLDNNEIDLATYQTLLQQARNNYTDVVQNQYIEPFKNPDNKYYELLQWNETNQINTTKRLNQEYSEAISTYTNNTSSLTGYDRLGLSAEFQTFLSSYKLSDGDYGLFLYLYVFGEVKPYIYMFSAKQNFFGDIYDFDSFYNQEIVFNIDELKNKSIIRMELYFYQDQNFKDVYDEYIYSKDYTKEFHETLFKEGNYQTLTDFFTSSNYTGYDPSDIGTGFSMYLPNLYMRDAYICLGQDISNFEGSDAAYLFSSSNIHYNSSQNENELAKYLNLRWIHKENDTGALSIINRSRFANMSNYSIIWYREEIGVRSPDEWAGENWQIIFTSLAGPSVNLETALNNCMYQQVIPRVELAQERYKVIILQRIDGIYKIVAHSDPITFLNSEEVENTTETDILRGLAIHCGDIDPNTGGLYSDAQQGMFFIYKKGNELEDASMAQEYFSTIPTFVSVKRYSDEIAPYLTEATKVVWTVPASYSMILPQYQNKMVSRPNLTAGNKLNNEQNNLFFNSEIYGEYRYLISDLILNSGRQIVCYNSLLDSFEYSFTGYSLLFNAINNTYIAKFEYKIRSTYSPAYINNTIQLDIEKDKIKYHAERTLYFGQSGTSGSDYTLIIDFEEQQNALSLYENSEGYAVDLGNATNRQPYQLIPFLRLVDQTGHQVIDLANTQLVQEKGYTFKWDWLTCEVNGDMHTSVPVDTDYTQLYPVFFRTSRNTSERNIIQKIYGCTGHNSTAATARPLGSAFGYSGTNTVIPAVAGADAKYALFDPYTKAEVPVTMIGDYYFWDRINNVFVQEFEPLKEGVQYYRRRRPTANESNWNKTIYEFSFERVKDQDLDTTKTYFIKIGDSYILDYNANYRKELVYYKAVYKGIAQASGNILSIQSPNTYRTRITLNQSYRYNGENHIPYIFDVMNSLSILRATVTGVCDYDLVAYWPVALRRVEYSNNTLKYLPLSITGATSVRYSSAGDLPDYYKNPYTLKYLQSTGEVNYQYPGIDDDLNSYRTPNPWSLICPTAVESTVEDTFKGFMNFIPANIDENNVLTPFSTYIAAAPLYGVQYRDQQGYVRWTQPILVYQDNYPSATLNKWNGTDLVIDEDNSSILATSIGAGKKENDNTFSGVIMGDWSKGNNSAEIASQTGIYGFSHGQMSYALKEDGTAFFGKDGSGRIHLMGDKAQLYSSNWLDETPEGMLLDLDDGVLQIQHQPYFIEQTYNSISTFQTAYAKITNNNYQIYEYRPYLPQVGRTVSLDAVSYDENNDNYKKIKNYYIPVGFVEYQSTFDNANATPYYLFNRTITTTETTLDSNIIPKDLTVYQLTASGLSIERNTYREVGTEIKRIRTVELYTYVSGALTSGTTYYRVSRYEQIFNLAATNSFAYTVNLLPAYLYRKNSLYYGRMNIKDGKLYNNVFQNYDSLKYTSYLQWNPTLRYFILDMTSHNKHHYLKLGDRTDNYALTIGTDTPDDTRDIYPQFKVEWDGTSHISGDVNVYDGHSVNVYGGDVNVDDGGGVNIYKGGKLLIYDNNNNLAIAAGSRNQIGSAKYDEITGSLVIYDDGNLILDGGNIYAYDGIIYGGEVRGGLFTRQGAAGANHTMSYQVGYNQTINLVVTSSSKEKYFEGVYGSIYEDASDINEFERAHALIDIDAGFLGEWFVSKDSIVSRDTGTYFFANGIDGRTNWSQPTMSQLYGMGIHSLKPPFLWNGEPNTPANIVTERVRVFYHHINGITSWADVGTFNGEKVTYDNSGQVSGTEPSTLLGIMSRSLNNGLGIQAEGAGSDIGIKSFASGVYISGGYKYGTPNTPNIHGRADFYVQDGPIKITSESKTNNAGATNGATGSTTPIYIHMNKGVLTIHTAKPEDQVGIYARFA